MDAVCWILSCASRLANWRSRALCGACLPGGDIWPPLIALVVLVSSSRAASNSPPVQLCSHNRTFCVEIIDKALPDSDPYEGFYTIVLSKRGHALSQLPTEGYLLGALWSPNGKYVAVNNRRGSSGDYVWLFRLTDGKALKVPHDEAAEDIVQQVSRKFPQFTKQTFNRCYTLARHWNTRNEIEIRTEVQFFNLSNAIIRVDEVDKIEGDRLVTVSQSIQEVPQRNKK